MTEDRPTNRDLWLKLRATIPESLHLLELLAEPIDQPYVERFVQNYNSEWLSLLLDEDQATKGFANIWARVRGRQHWEPLELLLIEHWISDRPSEVASSLPAYMNLEKTLHTVRTILASYFYNRAKEVNWREPLTYMRALRVAEFYLTGVVENIAYTSPESRKAAFGKLGASRTLQGQYGQATLRRIEFAVENLKRSIELGNNNPEARGYLARARLQHYDLSADKSQLSELVRHRPAGTRVSSGERLAEAEAWLRLAEISETDSGRQQFLTRAESAAQNVIALRAGVLDQVHALLITAIASFNRHARVPMPLDGLRLPFGLRRRISSWAGTERQGAREILSRCIESLRLVESSLRTEPIARRLLAQCHSLMAELLPENARNESRAQWHRSAVDIRDGVGNRRLSDPESSLENVRDLFALHEIKRQPHTLLQATIAALATADSDPTWATPVLLLATELSREPGPWPPGAKYELQRAIESPADPGLLTAVVARDVDHLYGIAARRALTSREIGRRDLGGRVGVFLAEDYSGVLNDQFVFKPTLASLADHEDRRTELVSQRIERLGLSSSFRLAKTLARTELPTGDTLRQSNCDVLVARTFHSGRLLADIARSSSAHVRQAWLKRAVAYLALFHSCDVSNGPKVPSPRKDLWKKELGRWLKSLRIDDRQGLFDQWWASSSQYPLVVRRDAHANNWVALEDGSLVALDLEAHGWRPLGYELAQLLDDVPLIPVDSEGWAERKSLVKEYARRAKEFGIVIEGVAVQEGYEMGMIARAVRHLTDPGGSAADRTHGRALLEMLSERGVAPTVRLLAVTCMNAWDSRSAATLGHGRKAKMIGESRRRHLSRAMAYQLRHGQVSSSKVERHGWMTLRDLVTILNSDGHRTTEEELRLVAFAIDEERFEISESGIRALYGHTLPVDMEYQPVTDGRTLYHGTSFERLNGILATGDGLLPGRRQWVHLSSDPYAAMLTARRHGPAVLLVIDTSMLPSVYSAGGSVYLSEVVPPAAISIVQPLTMFVQNIDSSIA